MPPLYTASVEGDACARILVLELAVYNACVPACLRACVPASVYKACALVWVSPWPWASSVSCFVCLPFFRL